MSDRAAEKDPQALALGRGPIAWARRTAHRYRHNFHYLRRVEWERIERYLEPRRADYICDVACGDGYYSRKMAARGARDRPRPPTNSQRLDLPQSARRGVSVGQRGGAAV